MLTGFLNKKLIICT